MRQITGASRPAAPPLSSWLNTPAGYILGLWLLLMITIPIANWTLGLPVVRQLVSATVVLQSLAVGLILIAAWGWRRALATFLVIVFVSLVIEMVGSHTGWLFGAYSYTDHLQPQLGGVPLLIPLAWFMMLPVAWALAEPFRGQLWHYLLFAALAMTAWDLFLDPQMVSWDLWVWTEPGLYFGIPLHNFVGWVGTALLLTWLLKPPPLPAAPLLTIYLLTWFLETFGLLFFWGLPGPALVGSIVMGSLVVVAWRAGLRDYLVTTQQMP